MFNYIKDRIINYLGYHIKRKNISIYVIELQDNYKYTEYITVICLIDSSPYSIYLLIIEATNMIGIVIDHYINISPP